MNIQIGNNSFTATLESSEAADALVDMTRKALVIIQMSDYSGFEKVGPLGTSLPTSNSQTTTKSDDVVLYNGAQIVIFYSSNSWSYTKLGKIDDLSGWEYALGSGNVTVAFSLEEYLNTPSANISIFCVLPGHIKTSCCSCIYSTTTAGGSFCHCLFFGWSPNSTLIQFENILIIYHIHCVAERYAVSNKPL